MRKMTRRSGEVCRLADGFRWWEKLYAQASFLTMGIAATIAIAREDWRWVLPYLVIYWYGIPGVIMRHLNCPRCPHLHEHGDCLQAPVQFTRWLVKRRKTTPFARSERWIFYAIFILIPTYPIYWLSTQPILAGIFATAVLMWYLGQWLYFCKRCRVEACPANRATRRG